MLRPNWSSWGKAEYSTPAPQWLRLGVPCVVFMSFLSDLNYIRQGPLDSRTAWLLAEMILAHAAVGIVLFSARLSVILCAVAMMATFMTDLPGFPLVAACVVTLVTSALCRMRLAIIHCFLSIAWVTAVAWHRDIAPIYDPENFWWTTFWLILLLTLIGLALRYLVIRTANTHARVKELEDRQEQIRQEERQNLARELHDVVAHHITVITMQVMAQRHSHDPDQLRETLRVIDDSAREALTELRALLEVLRTGEEGKPQLLSNQIVASQNVSKQVEQEAKSLARLGFKMHKISVDPRVDSLPFSVQITCIRVTQESTTNIIKHARLGAACSLEVLIGPTEVTITIINDQVKAKTRKNASDRDQSLSAGYGLTSLRERVSAAGGRYTAAMHGDKWIVEAHIPVPDHGRNKAPHSGAQHNTRSISSDTEEPQTSEAQEE